MKISYSRMSCYLSCPQKHHFRYVQGLKKKAPCRPLLFGKDFHKLLQYRNDQDELKKAKKEIRLAYNELSPSDMSLIGDNYLEDLKLVFKDYRKVWKDVEQPQNTEHEFLIRVAKIGSEPVYFHGLMDEVYEGGILGEHKTFTRKPNMNSLAMNTQVTLMSKAWYLETGEILSRVRWDFIHSAPSQQPIWLEKSSRFSEASSDKVTPMSWLRACKERGITDEETLSKADKYRGNISNFFFKAEFDLIPVMVDTTWDSFKYMCKEIVLRGHKNRTKNITKDCSFCDFRPICFGEFTGADVSYILNKDYTVQEIDAWSEDIVED